ncbi:alginate export family protein [bacterium]|nr:alginate export family protein [bacterium]
MSFVRHSRASALGAAIAAIAFTPSLVSADALTEAITGGKPYVDMRLRYEHVDLAGTNPSDIAEALTLRTRLGYTTAGYKGFSATIEAEDSRIVGGIGDFKVGPTGYNTDTQFAIIGDPETTEVDQAFIKYADDMVTAKLGRQVVTYDGHRFVGHVGWRQDRQTFDALRVDVKPVDELVLSATYIDERNRIFAEAADVESSDYLLNASYQFPIGKLVGYGYFLEVDASDDTLDTVGLSFSGAAKLNDTTKLLYAAEYAQQESETGSGSSETDTEYMLVEAGVGVGKFTGKLGYEKLGSDDGAGGFATPLATLHKFNGWADQFLGTPAEGLVDMYVSLAYKLGGGKLVAVYHDYEADDSSPTVDDLGDEINLLYARKFGKNYSAGIKYAGYSAGDIKVDTDKTWVWVGLNF